MGAGMAEYIQKDVKTLKDYEVTTRACCSLVCDSVCVDYIYSCIVIMWLVWWALAWVDCGVTLVWNRKALLTYVFVFSRPILCLHSCLCMCMSNCIMLFVCVCVCVYVCCLLVADHGAVEQCDGLVPAKDQHYARLPRRHWSNTGTTRVLSTFYVFIIVYYSFYCIFLNAVW